jgi:imidazolonepropionase-like amidohydrolase
LITHARVFTLTSQGTLEDAEILIRDGEIAQVGAVSGVPSDAKRIDASGGSVTPGLFNAYTHLGVVEIDLVSETVDRTTLDPLFSASFRVAPALNPRSTLVAQNRIHGVTHAVVAPESGHHVFAGQGAVVRLGGVDGFTLNADAGVFASYGSEGGLFAGGSRAAAYAKLRQSLADAREFAANRRAVMRGEWREFTLPLHDLEALVPVVGGAKPLVVSSHRASDMQALLDLKREFDLRLVINGATEGWLIAGQLAAAKVPVIIDPMANVPYSFDRLGARLDNAARLHAAGVELLFKGVDLMGTHAAWLVRQAAGNAAAYGLPPVEAIRAMTRNPAQVFGIGERFGSIAPGRAADLVIWDGDPLEVTTRATTVLIDGEVVPMVSRATRLRDRYLDLASPTPFGFRK